METLPSPWSEPHKIGFRFAFIFFGLFIIIQNNGAFPFWEVPMVPVTALLHTFIPWVGKNILHLSYDITVFTNGSGDTTYDYVIVFCIFSLALLGTVIWSLADRHRSNYSTLYYWLTVAIRFYVGFMLINYGLVKVIKLQFPSAGLSRLTQAYGDSSPMGLAWTFLGFSDGYNLFMGIAEVLAVLLLFRRTMTAGSILTLMTTANVMAVNYFYDVPVKILSTALFLMTLFLLLGQAQPLLQFFFSGKPVALPVIPAPEFKLRWLRLSTRAIKYLLLGYVLIYGFIETLGSRKQWGSLAPKSPLYGLYDVKTYIVSQDTVPPSLTETNRWRHVIMEYPGFSRIRLMSDSTFGLVTAIDTVNKTINYSFRSESSTIGSFQYTPVESGNLYLKGTLRNDSVRMELQLRPAKDFLLTNRGFHWINEYPFNR